MKKQIIFLNRAYNDLDTQMSLIDQFAADENFNVRVIGYPCDGDLGNPAAHEARLYLESKGVSLETILDDPDAPLHLKLLHKTERCFDFMRKSRAGELPAAREILKAVHVAVLMVMRKLLRKDLPWADKIAAKWNADMIVMDESMAQPGRSYIIDHTVPVLADKGVRCFIVLTGQFLYMVDSPTGAALPKYKATKAEKFFVPSQRDREFSGKCYPQENFEVLGNLRMERPWVGKLQNEVLAPPFYNKQAAMKPLKNSGKIKVVFMLSKMNYGVQADAIKNTIRALARHPDVDFVLKPHTRGMKFDFMSKDEIAGSVVADRIPSTLLCEWADLLLFTGSGIVFHGMAQRKSVGYLKYCQEHETMFDDGKSARRFDSQDELMAFIDKAVEKGMPKENYDEWLKKYIHAGDEKGSVAARYKAVMSEPGKKKKAA